MMNNILNNEMYNSNKDIIIKSLLKQDILKQKITNLELEQKQITDEIDNTKESLVSLNSINVLNNKFFKINGKINKLKRKLIVQKEIDKNELREEIILQEMKVELKPERLEQAYIRLEQSKIKMKEAIIELNNAEFEYDILYTVSKIQNENKQELDRIEIMKQIDQVRKKRTRKNRIRKKKI